MDIRGSSPLTATTTATTSNMLPSTADNNSDYDRPYTGSSYADLPMEITIHIMDYLHPADLYVASLACTRWFNAAQHPHFAAAFTLDFPDCTLHDDADPLATFAASMRSYAAVQLRGVDFNGSAGTVGAPFWARFAHSLHRVAIRECDLREKTLKSILLGLHRLTHLEIENCRELFMPGRLFEAADDAAAIRDACQHIEHLALIDNRYLSDALFERFVSLMPRLRSLNLARCHISFHPGLYRKFYPAPQQPSAIGTASESVLTFQYIARFLTGAAARTLQHLCLSGTLVDESALQTISGCAELRLVGLQLAGCDQLTNASIVRMVREQPALRELDVSQLARLTDVGLTEICERLGELRVLRIGRCRAITDAGARELRRLRELRVLDMSDCDELTSAAVLEGVASVRNERLRELNVSALRICQLAIMRAVEAFPGLRTLDASSCKNGVTDLAVQWICRYAVRLRVLRLEYCEKISDVSLTGAGMDAIIRQFEATSSRSAGGAAAAPAGGAAAADDAAADDAVDAAADDAVDLGIPADMFNRNPYKISLRSKAEEDIVNDARLKKSMLARFEADLWHRDTHAKPSASSPYSINRLRGLRTLHLTGCARITDVWLRYSFRLPELRAIALAHCQQISGWGIERLVRNCPSLEHVDLSGCDNVNDRAVEMLAVHLRRLTQLRLERCSLLTDHALDHLAVHCERLRVLNVRGCRSMGAEPQQRLQTLRSLRRCDQSKPELYADAGTLAAVAFRMPRAPPMRPWNRW